MPLRIVYLGIMLSLISADLLQADEELAFFKERIEPVLEKHCYSCHSAAADSIKGGLRLDTKSTIRRGGESGPAVVPGNVDDSQLITALLKLRTALRLMNWRFECSQPHLTF